MAVIEVNDGNFEKEVMEKSKKIPVIVDFYAGWCMPCTMIAPVLEKLAKEFDGRILLAKLNTETNPATGTAAGISSIPAIALVKDGKIVDGFIGLKPEEFIRNWIEVNISE